MRVSLDHTHPGHPLPSLLSRRRRDPGPQLSSSKVGTRRSHLPAPYAGEMPSKPRRRETRVSTATDEQATRDDVTLMDPALFDALVESLETPDPAPALRRKAQAPRHTRLG